MSGHMVGDTSRTAIICLRNAWSGYVRSAETGGNCKTVAKATVVRIHYPPQTVVTASDQHKPGRRPFLLGPAGSDRRRPVTGVHGNTAGHETRSSELLALWWRKVSPWR